MVIAQALYPTLKAQGSVYLHRHYFERPQALRYSQHCCFFELKKLFSRVINRWFYYELYDELDVLDYPHPMLPQSFLLLRLLLTI